MNIIISKEVENFLRACGKRNITIYSEIPSSCWSPRPEIFVSLEEPEVPSNYKLYNMDNLNIYLYSEAKLENDTITIDMSERVSDLANKEFDIHGLILE